MSIRALATATSALLLAALVACGREPNAPPASATTIAQLERAADAEADASADLATPSLVRQLAAARNVGALPPRPYVRPALARLGRALAFDPILSGNRNISCASCHLPGFATGDGRALSVGEGAVGSGPNRVHPRGVFIARNAPALFNLGAMKHLFWDGRVSTDPDGTVHTPAGALLTPRMARTFEFGAVSALGMFPVTNRAEMRGAPGDTARGNELGAIPDADLPAMWAALMRRLAAIPEYRTMFEEAYPGTRMDDMTFAHASNAIGGFLVDRLTLTGSPWDRFLAGDDRALSQRQLEGARTFLTLKCSLCHNGATFSDEQFHNVAVAQIGPGEGDGAGGRDDFGRMRVTGDPRDRYRFRTTPLRNVELTAPYGHDGSIASLREFVAHYSESDRKLLSFDPGTLEPALRTTFLPSAADVIARRDTIILGVVLTPTLVDRLTDYMRALTDDAARDLSRLTPERVPSGLPVAHR